MLKQMRIETKLLMILTVALFSECMISGCMSLPPKPTGEMCLLNVQESHARCRDIQDGHYFNKPIADLDNWVMMSSNTYQGLMDWIIELKNRLAKTTGQVVTSMKDFLPQ